MRFPCSSTSKRSPHQAAFEGEFEACLTAFVVFGHCEGAERRHSTAAKRKLYQSLAQRFEAAGVSAGDLFVVITEPPLDNWSPRNGVSSADVKPSFKLDV